MADSPILEQDDTSGIQTPQSVPLAAAPQAPDAPMSALSGGDIPGNPIAPGVTPTNPQMPTEKQPGVMQRMLAGALLGLAGGAGQKTFAGGVGGGARAVLGQAQLEKENAMRQQQQQMEQQRTNAEVQAAQDAHTQAQASMAMAHVRMLELQREYDLAPKTYQEALDQQGAKLGLNLKAEGAQTVFSGSHDEAMQRVMAERTASPNSALNFVAMPTGSGQWEVLKVADPSRTNEKPVDVTIGYDLKGKPITKTYSPGSITAGKVMDLETNAAKQLSQVPLMQSEVSKNYAQANAANASASLSRSMTTQPGANAPDVTGWKPSEPLNRKEEQLARRSFASSPAFKTAQSAEQSYQMADKAYQEYKAANGNLPTGAQSMLLLSQHLATTFGTVKGSRVTKDMIEHHLGARGVSDSSLAAVQRLVNGDQLSPDQWEAFHQLIGQSRTLAWKNAIQTAHTLQLPVTGDMVPADVAGGKQGGGKGADPLGIR